VGKGASGEHDSLHEKSLSKHAIAHTLRNNSNNSCNDHAGLHRSESRFIVSDGSSGGSRTLGFFGHNGG
jgi:hypothetical protein